MGMKRKSGGKFWKISKAISAVLIFGALIYLVNYLPRRSSGSYRWTQSGELRLGGFSAMSDLEQWSPEGCWWQPNFKTIAGDYETRSDYWGRVYAPLIKMDRKFNFPDRPAPYAKEFLSRAAGRED